MVGKSPSLESLLENPRVWRGRSYARGRQGLASGYDILDRHLPDGGWPRQSLTEILVEHHGIGELQILMPALVRLSVDPSPGEHAEPGWIAWVVGYRA